MRLLTFRYEREWRGGIEQRGEVVALSDLPSAYGVNTVKDLIGLGPNVLATTLSEASRNFDSGDRVIAVDDLAVGPPVPDPEKILMLGSNYRSQIAALNIDTPAAPSVYAKFRNCLIGDRESIILPPATSTVLYEGELAAVIGRRCRAVREEEALDCVVGYAVFNDITARELRLPSSHQIELSPNQQLIGKAADTFGPFGPAIALAKDVGDPQNLWLTTRLNGAQVQQESTSTMLYTVARAIAFLSSIMTLEPGDIIVTGSPAGVGTLGTGDLVEIEIERVGKLANPVVAGRS